MEQHSAGCLSNDCQDSRFSFDHGESGTPKAASEEHSQEASLLEVVSNAGAGAEEVAQLAALKVDSIENLGLADGNTHQEPSLLQIGHNSQEPSLAHSANSFAAPAVAAADVCKTPATSSKLEEVQADAAAYATGEAVPSQMQELGSYAKTAEGVEKVTTPLQVALKAASKNVVPGSPQQGANSKMLALAPTNTAATDLAPAATHPLDTAACRQPDRSYFVDGMRALDVEVECGPGTSCKLLHVLMDVTAVQQNPKPYLGGYRHKKNGVVYHHACSQTPPQLKQQKGAKVTHAAEFAESRQKLSRETQTVRAANTSCQTVREASTQMAGPGLELDCTGDRLLTPRTYIAAAVVGQWQAKAALCIQRYTRGWLARRRAAVLRAIKQERDDFLASAAAEREAAVIANRTREVERRTHPSTREDFELLGRELETWRQQQTAAIKAAAEAAEGRQQKFEQQAALQLLLAKETRLLQTLDKLRVNAKHENKVKNTNRVLGNMSQPKTWSLSNGKKVMVHTPTTVRAAELQQLYRGLTLPNLTLDERLDVLLHVKWAVKEFDCSLTRELVELIDREADLLNRGRSPKTLDGLRQRISGQFLAFCKTPAFNPEAHHLQLVPGGLSEPETFEYADDIIGTQTAD